jgi:hypothetical protein
MAWLKRRGRGSWEELTPLAGVTGKCAIRKDNDTVTFLTNGLTTGGGIVNLVDLQVELRPVPDPAGINGRQGYLVGDGEVRLVSVFGGRLRLLGATAGTQYAGTVTWQAGA